MFDGIGDHTEIWRGRAAFQAGPTPGAPVAAAGVGTRADPLPGLIFPNGRFLRYQTALPLLPGDILASVVAARRPDSAQLLREVSPHWEKLRQLGARTRELLKTDAEVMSDLLAEASREFHGLLDAGLHKEAKQLSGVMDLIEMVISELPGYPGLEEAVIESAHRTLAFLEHSEPLVDFLSAGGISVVKETSSRSGGGFGRLNHPHPGHIRPPSPSSIDSGHPFLGSWGSMDPIRTGDAHGIDVETGEECFTARGGRELGILLADLCRNGEIKVNVKSFLPHGKASRQLGLRERLAARRRATTTTTVELPGGVSPQETLIRLTGSTPDFDFPAWTKPFAVFPAVSYTHAQDFIVDNGAVLFSYVSENDEHRPGCRLDDRVFRLNDIDATRIDAPLNGDIVTDRHIAAQMARRALRHARTLWSKKAPPHRLRVALTSDGKAVVAAVHLCGLEPYYGIPYDRMLRALKDKRDRFFANVYRHPMFIKQVKSRRYRGHSVPVPEPERCEQAARSLLFSRTNTDYRRLSHISEFMSELAASVAPRGQNSDFDFISAESSAY
ncbi:hypothetical protein HFO56_02920 [Rhizobium laguerreae]|uniref:hypothetical protein n=1 Tax=Rhizobium laguerreae TaxID=1076926 RepID=UPI001C90BB98|nr:hypothetical protein [Rhizobium laguerreae]MBY3151339.1 hypothetical protein [Rhizobium laguerreae]